VDGEVKSRFWRWSVLWRDIADRFRDPLGHPTFVFFFVFVVIGLGSAGTWVELFKLWRSTNTSDPLDGLITSLVTFFFALIGTSCTQIIIEDAEAKALKTLAQGVLLTSVLGVILATAGIGTGVVAALAWGAASAFALAVWWIANSKSASLRDPDAATGGSLSKDLPGSLSGYTTE
jgi:hypothetical protein